MKPDDTAVTQKDQVAPAGTDVPEQSRYEDYDDTFHRYDTLRRPTGAGDIIAAFARASVPLARQTILEGGFGTGNYIQEVAPHVAEVIGLEASSTGVEQARTKLAGQSNVRLEQGNILALGDSGLQDASVHGYMVNQVLHHIDEPGSEFPNLNRFRDEAARVLVPGGVMTISTCTQLHLDPEAGVYWNYKYIPERASRLRSRYIPIPDLILRMQEQDAFQHTDTVILKDNIFAESYWEPENMATRSFQSGDSVYAGVTPEEVEHMAGLLKRDREAGTLTDHIAASRSRAQEDGWSVLVCFTRVAP